MLRPIDLLWVCHSSIRCIHRGYYLSLHWASCRRIQDKMCWARVTCLLRSEKVKRIGASLPNYSSCQRRLDQGVQGDVRWEVARMMRGEVRRMIHGRDDDLFLRNRKYAPFSRFLVLNRRVGLRVRRFREWLLRRTLRLVDLGLRRRGYGDLVLDVGLLRNWRLSRGCWW